MTPQGENRFFVMGWNGYWLKNPQVLCVLLRVVHLEPARHPLREYDGDLGDNPWIGDRYRNPPVET